MKLTHKQERFVAEYLLDLNAKQAAIRAGYSAKTAEQQAYRLMANAHIQVAIAAKNAEHLTKLDVTIDRVLKERARLAFFDPRKLFDEKGKPIPIHELDEDTAAIVAGFEYGGDGVAKVKLADKNASLTALEKHLGMYKDEDGRHQGGLSITLHLGDEPPSLPATSSPDLGPFVLNFHMKD
ncbi:MAG TPA: terminase small subunit [Trinickia sp.]|uniref:terminase small subunit n=1 Tax=Trinickia sp. TaxID=2571163 RepID=UPI002D19F0D2|nr:terminase small subunit [Trinickia sp.]HVW50821.1 terminase small subunit [Trinickia sp.]